MDGIILVDKDSKTTSARVTHIVSGITRSKCGHAGTLDPIATGLLILGIGKATKVLSMIAALPKTYKFEVKFGEETDTLDGEGVVTRAGGPIPSQEAIEEAITRFKGSLEQVIPDYSAHKISGVRSYKLARRNVKITRQTKSVVINEFNLLGYNPPYSSFEVVCSSGTYVRALARDVAYHLSTYAHISSIRRVAVGQIRVESALFQDELSLESITSNLRTVDSILGFLPKICLDEETARRFRNGVEVQVNADAQYARVYCDNRFIGISKLVTAGYIKPYKVLF